MTAKLIFEYTQIELSKVKAPSLLLEDFNYLFNKAINNYINRRYGIYDTSQQTTDDLRVLKSTAILTPKRTTLYDRADETGTSDWSTSYLDGSDQILNSYLGNTNEVTLPKDYLHMLNCICIFKVKKNYKCYDQGSYIQFAATRLDSDKYAQIINDWYNRPSYKRPYYFIHNVNTSEDLSTNPITYEKVVNSITYNLVEYYNMSKTTGTLKITVNLKEKSYTVNRASCTVFDKTDGEVVTPILPARVTVDISDNLDLYSGELTTLYAKINGTPSTSSGLNITLQSTAPSSSYNMYKLESTSVETSINNLASGTDIIGEYSSSDGQIVNENFPRTIDISGFDDPVSTIEKPAGIRYSNQSNVRLEIRYGKDNRTIELVKVLVDYIKSPQFIRLTPEQMDLVEDTSQVMEFPDYVCQEIINELVMLVMENTADPRLQTNMAVNQSTNSAAQLLAQQQAAAQAQAAS